MAQPSATACSSTPSCAWRPSPSSTSRAGASRRSPARCRRARGRSTTGPGAAPKCDRRMPYPIRYRPDALLNPAVFHDAMPASVIKPIMAAAFLSDPDVGARWLAAERAAMQRTRHAGARTACAASSCARTPRASSTACSAPISGFAHCGRPWEVQAMAPRFGWNGGCATPREDCGKRDLLFGGAVDDGGDARRRAARELVSRTAVCWSSPLGGGSVRRSDLRPAIALDTAKVARVRGGCRRPRRARRLGEVPRPHRRRRRRRRLGAGQCARERARRRGHDGCARRRRERRDAGARAASRRAPCAASPATVRRRSSCGEPLRTRRRGAEPPRARRRRSDPERAVVQPSRGHGAARLRAGVRRAHLPRHRLDRRQDRHADVSERRRLARRACAPVRAAARAKTQERARRVRAAAPLQVVRRRLSHGPGRSALDEGRSACSPSATGSRESGRIHGAGDHGPNPAAEIAMQIAGRHAGFLPWGAPMRRSRAAPRDVGRQRRRESRKHRSCGPSTAVRDMPRRHRGHAATRDRAGRRCVARRVADRAVAARAAGAGRSGRRHAAGVGRVPRRARVALRIARRAAAPLSARREGPWPRWSLPTGAETMSLKNWILGRMNGVIDARRPAARVRAPHHRRRRGARSPREPRGRRRRAPARTPRRQPEHLGPYAPLVAAIREELEHSSRPTCACTSRSPSATATC